MDRKNVICPKCKTEVNSKDILCPECKLRLKFKCPRCADYTRIGSSSCSSCGFAFVKFCPSCNSSNYASALECRKCSHQFESDEKEQKTEEKTTKKVQKTQAKKDETSLKSRLKKTAQEPKKVVSESKLKKVEQVVEEIEEDIEKSIEKKASKKTAKKIVEKKEKEKLVVYIDFTNLDSLFKKYLDDEFKQRVVQNIKNSIKLGFNVSCEFINPHTAFFKIAYANNIKLLDRVNHFCEEFDKFNSVLGETLGAVVNYKFAVVASTEFKLGYTPVQLKLGIEKDIITSNEAYKLLKDEIPLIKVSPESYKMVFLDQKAEFEENESYKEAHAIEMALNALVDEQSETRAVSLNAQRGGSKTYILEKIYERLEKDDKHFILKGHCSAITQVTPLGLIQDICLELFNSSFVPIDYENKALEIKQKLEQVFANSLEEDKIETLINIIYPMQEAYFEDILINKKKTFEDLRDILELLKARKEMILSIDDFDLIDETSFDFIKYLVEADFFKSQAKLIITYRNQHAIGMYINSEKLPPASCLNINIAHKENVEIKEYIKSQLGNFDVLPRSISNQIVLNAQGNIGYVEQAIHGLIEEKVLYLDKKQFVFDIDKEDSYIINNFADLLYARLDYLKEKNDLEHEFLLCASMLGGKFTRNLMMKVFSLNFEEFEKIAALLDKLGYIKRRNDEIFEFKNSLVWSHVYANAKECSDLFQVYEVLLDKICETSICSPAIAALLAQLIGAKDLSFKIWTNSLRLASFIGDINFYTLCQKQSLILLEDVKLPNFDYVKNNIFERLGKLTYNKNPQEAIEYLSSAIVSAQNKGDENKIVELSGYLIHSCKLAQNYSEIVETVDAVLNHFTKTSQSLQRAMIKTRKLEALLQLGNWSEISSLVNNEINPVLQNYIKKAKGIDFTTQKDIYDTWIKANIILSESYAQQGNPLSNELLEEIQKELNKDKITDNTKLFLLLDLAHACAQTSRGYIKDSDEILQSILKDYSYVISDLKLVSKWNLIDIVNKVLSKETDDIKDDLFEATAFANNCSDEYSKNILKALLAYVLLKENNPTRALEICAEQMNYFSEKKIAFGALLTWYISAKATLTTSGPERCIEICEKAVPICDSAKINSIYFKILFQELLSRSYLQKNDFENAKMYCELALQDANANELIFLQMVLERLRANVMQDSIVSYPQEQKSYIAQNTIKVYDKAIMLASRLSLDKHKYIIQKELTAFRAYCQLKRIS